MSAASAYGVASYTDKRYMDDTPIFSKSLFQIERDAIRRMNREAEKAFKKELNSKSKDDPKTIFGWALKGPT